MSLVVCAKVVPIYYALYSTTPQGLGWAGNRESSVHNYVPPFRECELVTAIVLARLGGQKQNGPCRRGGLEFKGAIESAQCNRRQQKIDRNCEYSSVDLYKGSLSILSQRRQSQTPSILERTGYTGDLSPSESSSS